MLCVLPFCAKDKHIAVRLAEWIRDLGGVKRHNFILAYNKDTDVLGVEEPMKAAFAGGDCRPLDVDEAPYPIAANEMWKQCVWGLRQVPGKPPWLWLEPDAIPLVPTWLDQIEAEYLAKGKPFMFDRVQTPTRWHGSGVGVYPSDVLPFCAGKLPQLGGMAWDVFFHEQFSPNAHFTELIHERFHEAWGDINSGEPIFYGQESLAKIEQQAVIFHRNKSGRLIELLRDRLAVPASAPAKSGDKVAIPTLMPEPHPLESLVQRLEERFQDIEARLRMLEINSKPFNPKTFEGAMDWSEPIAVKPAHIGKQRGVPMKRKTMSPEHKAKVQAALAKARAAKKAKQVPTA